MTRPADHLLFVGEALDAMVEIVAALGDDLACAVPDLPGANSPYAILTHCLGVLEFWGGEAIAGRPIVRDRPSEFRATGSVTTLVDRVAAGRARFAADLQHLDPLAAPRTQDPEVLLDPATSSQARVMLHVHRELAQHHGQMEITRDLLRRG